MCTGLWDAQGVKCLDIIAMVENKSRKKIKIIGEVKSKVKIVSDMEKKPEKRRERSNGKVAIIEEIDSWRGISKFKAPKIVLEASVSNSEGSNGGGDIQRATTERKKFDKEDTRRRIYDPSKKEEKARDSYGNSNYSTAETSSNDVFKDREPINGTSAIRGRDLVQKDGIRDINVREERYQTNEDKYQTGQEQQKRKKNSWEA